MNLFLKKIGLFSVIMIVLLVCGEVFLRHVPDSYSCKDNLMKSRGEATRVLVLGNSHTYYGIKPELLGDSTVNLANVSQTPDYDLDLLHHYADRLSNLELVVIPLSYHTLREPDIEDLDEWWRAIGYKTRMGIDRHSDFSRYNFEIANFSGYSAKLKNFIFPAEKNACDSLGFGLGFDLSNRNDSWATSGKTRAEILTFASSERVDSVKAVFDSIISLCDSLGARILFVTTPAWHTFREAVDAGQMEEVIDYGIELARRPGIDYLNLYADSLFTDPDFRDTDHLSDVGAVKLSSFLRPTVDSLLNQKNPYSCGIGDFFR